MRNNPLHRFPSSWLLSGLLLLYILSIFWINFHAYHWYNCDTYPDTYAAKLMAEQKTLFPDGFVFGNQLFVVSTPVLAAVLHWFTKDCVTAMAIASCLMTLFLLFSYVWCLKPFISFHSLLVGAICLVGGTIFGARASGSVDLVGMSYFYTMTAFYATYVIVLFLVLGCWLRLRHHIRIPSMLLVVTAILSFGIGMNSSREMLVLFLPLLVTELFFVFRNKEKDIFTNRSLCFTLIFFALNGLGILISLQLNFPQEVVYKTGFSISDIPIRFHKSMYSFANIAGLQVYKRGFKSYPLFVAAVFVFLTTLFSLYKILRKNDFPPLSMLILVLWFSIAALFAVGSFYIDMRPAYFFIYYILAAVSCVYLIQEVSATPKRLLTYTILAISSVSYCYHFIHDFQEYHKNDRDIVMLVNDIVNDGYRFIFTDPTVSPYIAAYSPDHLTNIIVKYSPVKDHRKGIQFLPTPFFIPYDTYKGADIDKTLLCLSGWEINMITDENFLFERIERIGQIKHPKDSNKDVVFFRILDPSIIGQPNLVN